MIADETQRLAFARAAQVAAQVAAETLAPAGADMSGVAAREIADDTADWSDMCQSCGACCSYSADWPRFSLEPEAHLDSIPRELVDDTEHGMRCVGNRCAALTGIVGRSTSCAIYALRPHVCEACTPGDDACREARRHFGL